MKHRRPNPNDVEVIAKAGEKFRYGREGRTDADCFTVHLRSFIEDEMGDLDGWDLVDVLGDGTDEKPFHFGWTSVLLMDNFRRARDGMLFPSA
jgi:hypothetical protein